MVRLECIARRLPDITLSHTPGNSLQETLAEYWCTSIHAKKRSELRTQGVSWRDVLALDWMKGNGFRIEITKEVCKEPKFTTLLEDVLLTTNEVKEERYQIADTKLLAAHDYVSAVHTSHAHAVVETLVSREQYKALAALEHIIEHLPTHRREQLGVRETYASLREGVVQGVIFSRAEKAIDTLQVRVITHTKALEKSKKELSVLDITNYREVERELPPVEGSENDSVLWTKIQVLLTQSLPAYKEVLTEKYKITNERFLQTCREEGERVAQFREQKQLSEGNIEALKNMCAREREVAELYRVYGERDEIVVGFTTQNTHRATELLTEWETFTKRRKEMENVCASLNNEQRAFEVAVQGRAYERGSTSLALVNLKYETVREQKENRYFAPIIQETDEIIHTFYETATAMLESAQEKEHERVLALQKKIDERKGFFASIARPFRRRTLKIHQATYAEVTNAVSCIPHYVPIFDLSK